MEDQEKRRVVAKNFKLSPETAEKLAEILGTYKKEHPGAVEGDALGAILSSYEFRRSVQALPESVGTLEVVQAATESISDAIRALARQAHDAAQVARTQALAEVERAKEERDKARARVEALEAETAATKAAAEAALAKAEKEAEEERDEAAKQRTRAEAAEFRAQLQELRERMDEGS